MTYYLVIFAAGFAGSFHCIGMCGGFACGLGRDPRGASATAARHLIYNIGRLTTYCFLGGLAGALGQVICTPQGAEAAPLLDGALDFAQRSLAIVAGLLMIAMALQFFGILQIFHRLAIGFGGSTFAMRCAACWHRAASPRRSPSACSTASCHAPWSMPSSRRRRAPPRRIAAFWSWRRSGWEPFPRC